MELFFKFHTFIIRRAYILSRRVFDGVVFCYFFFFFF